MSNLPVASHNLAAKLLDLIKAMPTDKYDALNAKYKDYVAAVEVAKAAIAKAKEKCVECGACGAVIENEEGWTDCRKNQYCDECKEGLINYPYEAFAGDEPDMDDWVFVECCDTACMFNRNKHYVKKTDSKD